MKWELKKLTEEIYWLAFDNRYDLAMHFLRAQESYESPKFKGENFTIAEYMAWYAKDHGGVFTYPNDWRGFNVPGRILDDLSAIRIEDFNKYDRFMSSVCDLIGVEVHEIYLIGSLIGDLETVKHEIAHALYYTDVKYAERMNNLLAPNAGALEDFYAKLESKGYDSAVLIDEAQAYLATGLTKDLEGLAPVKLEEACATFFAGYVKDLGLAL